MNFGVGAARSAAPTPKFIPGFSNAPHLNEILPDYDVLICTPTLETGVSIDLKGHFTSVWGCLQGVVPDNSARQALARLREPVPRHLWISKMGIGRVGNGSTSIKSLLSSQHQQAKSHRRQLQDMLTGLDENGDINIDLSALRIWAKMASRINAGMGQYRDVILSTLTAEGHHIVDQTDFISNPFLIDLLATTRDNNYRKTSLAIAQAEEIDEKTYQELTQRREKTEAERQQEQKYRLAQRYQIPATPELVQLDNEGWHPRIRLHYYLTVGRAYLKERDKKAAERCFQDGKVWLPDFNQSQLGLKIYLLAWLGVLDLLTSERAWKGTDPEIIRINDLLISHFWEVKAILGIGFNASAKNKPIQSIQRLLDVLGIQLRCIGRESRAGARLYQFVLPDDGRERVFDAWLKRDQGGGEDATGTPPLPPPPLLDAPPPDTELDECMDSVEGIALEPPDGIGVEGSEGEVEIEGIEEFKIESTEEFEISNLDVAVDEVLLPPDASCGFPHQGGNEPSLVGCPFLMLSMSQGNSQHLPIGAIATLPNSRTLQLEAAQRSNPANTIVNTPTGSKDRRNANKNLCQSSTNQNIYTAFISFLEQLGLSTVEWRLLKIKVP